MDKARAYAFLRAALLINERDTHPDAGRYTETCEYYANEWILAGEIRANARNKAHRWASRAYDNLFNAFNGARQ